MKPLIKRILRESNSVIKKETFTNKFGEDMTLVLNDDGTILFKHEDYKNEYVPLDKLYDQIFGFGFKISLASDEIEFFNNFIKGTKYQPIKSRISYIKLHESDWLDDLSNQFSGMDLPFEVAKNPMNRPKKANLFVMKTGWEYGDAYLREEFVFNMEDPNRFETFVNVCKFYLALLDDRDYDRWKDVSALAKSVGLALGSFDDEELYGTPKDMSDFIFGSDYPAHLESVEISYFDQGGVEYDVRLKEPD